ncbi:MAG: DUF2800 domain-containing protein, partial [Hyphomicrobium sp.]
MSVAAHSALGASKAKQWLACPGSVALAARFEPDPPGKAAREGTAAHAWAEFCLANGEVDADGYIDAEYPSAELAALNVPMTREMADAINVYLEFVWSVLQADDELHVERRFSLEFIAPGMFGTNDCAVLKRKARTLHVIDYKHGAGVYVDEKDNVQTQYYALGALHAFIAEGPFDKIVLTIVQPRAGGEPVRSQIFDAID